MSADPDDKPVPRFRRSDEFSRFGVEPKVWFRAPENKTLAAQCARRLRRRKNRASAPSCSAMKRMIKAPSLQTPGTN